MVRADDLIAAASPHPKSGSTQALFALRELVAWNPGAASAVARDGAEKAFLEASEVYARAEEQVATEYAVMLGALKTRRAVHILRTFVDRGLAESQSLSAIGWLKDPADLPKIARMLFTPAGGQPPRRRLTGLPNSL